MVKKAYKKLFLSPLWRKFIAEVLICLFLYYFVLSMHVSEELMETFLVICLGIPTLFLLVVLYCAIRYVFQVQKASSFLRTLPDYTLDRLEYDLKTEERIDDLYFTSDFLLVYQVSAAKKQGFACIPYTEIESLRISQLGNKHFVEILNPENVAIHVVRFKEQLNMEQVKVIGEKIVSLQDRERSVRTTEEEQAVRDIAAKRKRHEDMVSAGLPAVIINFIAIMMFLCSAIVAENYRKQLRVLENAPMYEKQPLMFWPNLLFFAAMFVSILLLLISFILYMRNTLRASDETLQKRINRWTILAFTAGAMLFILFMGMMYASDVQAWDTMIRGFHWWF